MNKFNENIDFLFDKEFESEDEVLDMDPIISVTAPRSYSPKEAFCALFSNICMNKDSFEQHLQLLSTIQEEALVGQVGRSLKNIDSYWDIVKEFKNLSEEETSMIVLSAKHARKQNALAAASKALWNEGSSAASVGVDPVNNPDLKGCSDTLVRAVGDMREVVASSHSAKTVHLNNTINAIVACMPNKERVFLKTQRQRNDKVQALLVEFDEGRLSVAMDAAKFSPPKEAGVSLPHTMETKEWLAITASAMVQKLWGSQFLVAFNDSNAMDMRKVTDSLGDYLLFRAGDVSPFDLDVHPAIYCNEYLDNGEWKWRQEQEALHSRVSCHFKSNPHEVDNQVARGTLFLEYQRESAEAYKNSSDYSIKISRNMPFFGRIPDELSSVLGNSKYILKFFKRGFSTAKQVGENGDFIHVVSNSVADSFSEKDYYPIMLTDLNSVILVPVAFWAKSQWELNEATSGKKFRSSFGLKRVKASLSSLALFMTMYRLSHVKCMYDSWFSNHAYNYVAHTNKLVAHLLSRDDGFNSLFGMAFAKPTKQRRRLCIPFISLVPGAIVGLWIAPATSKQGKASIGVIQENVGFASEMDDYQLLDVPAPVDYDWDSEQRYTTFDEESSDSYDNSSVMSDVDESDDLTGIDQGDIGTDVSEETIVEFDC